MSPPESPSARYRFGTRVLDPARRELRCDDVPQQLPARTFECLHYLIAHRDRAVGRDELVRAVFGRRAVSDAQLAQIVLRARRAIGDDGQEQRAIRTVPRFGFRWAADVEVIEAASTDAVRDGVVRDVMPQATMPVDVPVVEATDDEAPFAHTHTLAANDDGRPFDERPFPGKPAARKPRSRTWRMAAACLALAALVVGFVSWPGRSHAPAALAHNAPPHAIIVLPMQVEGAGTAAWARLGMMDFVVDRLRRANQPVWSSEATLALLRTRDRAGDPQRVRHDTQANWIVESRARNVPEGWDVTMTATDASGRVRNGAAQNADLVAATRLASDRLLVGIGAASPAIALDAPDLDERLQRAQSALLANDPDAAQTLLLGATPAQQKTPLWQFRAAQVDLAAGRFVGGIDRLSRLLHTDAFKKDAPLRSQAYALQGMLLVRLDRFADAERSYEQAIELLGATTDASSLGRALIGRGAARMAQGRFDDALADLGRARIQLTRAGDRLSVAKVDGNLGILEMQRDHPQQAVAAFEKAERDFQAMGATLELAGVRNMLMTLYLQLLDPAKALAVADRAWAAREHLHDPTVIGHLHLARAEVLATVGRLREARGLVEQLPDGLIAGPGDADRLHYVQVELARQTGDLVETARLAETALIDWPGDRNPRLRAWVAYRLQDAALEGHLPAPGNDAALAGDRLSEKLGAAIRSQRAGHPDIADTHYRDAVDFAEQTGIPGTIANAVIARAHWLMDAGRLDEAAASIGRVAPWAEQDFDLSLLQVELYARLHQPRAWQASLEQARRLAGERPIPSALRAASPGGPLANAAASR